MLSVLQGYHASTEFTHLAARTQRDYTLQVRLIEKDFGDLPVRALAERGCRGLFMEWRDKLALRSRRQADYAWVVLARVLSWSLNRGLVAANPCELEGVSIAVAVLTRYGRLRTRLSSLNERRAICTWP
jgi:hypothetical protein